MTIGAIIGTIIFGAVIGILARAVLPGRQSISAVVTVILGILGALIGYWVWGSVMGKGDTSGIDGIRWPTVPELLSATREVALNESRWAALSREAMVGARRFSREAFDEATLGLLTATSGMS